VQEKSRPCRIPCPVPRYECDSRYVATIFAINTLSDNNVKLHKAVDLRTRLTTELKSSMKVRPHNAHSPLDMTLICILGKEHLYLHRPSREPTICTINPASMTHYPVCVIRSIHCRQDVRRRLKNTRICYSKDYAEGYSQEGTCQWSANFSI
jgi:hypothetical protein